MLFRNLYGWRSEVCVKLSEDEEEEVADREALTYKINENAKCKCQNPIVGSVHKRVFESQNTKPLKGVCVHAT